MKDIFVPEEHAFSLTKPSSFANGPLYHFPFDALAVINMACMLTGIVWLVFIGLFKRKCVKYVTYCQIYVTLNRLK